MVYGRTAKESNREDCRLCFGGSEDMGLSRSFRVNGLGLGSSGVAFRVYAFRCLRLSGGFGVRG